MTAPRAFVVAAVRTPIGRAWGRLADVSATDLATAVVRAAWTAVDVPDLAVDDVILGNASGGGGNPARFAAVAAGLGEQVPGMTIDRQCGAGLEAVVTAARMVEAGAVDCVIAGGVESTSTAPWRVERPRRPRHLPRFFDRPAFVPVDQGDTDMGMAAENVATAYGISRERQDAFALASHQKAMASEQDGRFDAERVAVAVPGREDLLVDECPRADTTLEALAALPPVFRSDGTVTAGNSCPLNDGAAAVVIVSESMWKRLGRPPALGFLDSAASGVDPQVLGIGPVPAIKRLEARGRSPRRSDHALIEFNEAFASQVIACMDLLDIDPDRLNVGGGAIALGHPYGASGAILVTRLFHELVGPSASPRNAGPRNAGHRNAGHRNAGHRNAGSGLATLGIGGGMGLAAAFVPAEGV